MRGDGGGELFEFSGFVLDARQRVLRGARGEPVPLAARAFETLLYLVSHPNQLIEKQVLMKAVWPNAVVEENNLSQSICVLRRVLGETPGEHRFIVTVPGRGFRFVALVRRMDALAERATRAQRGALVPAPAALERMIAVPSTSADPHEGLRGMRRAGARRWVPWAAAALVICGVLAAMIRMSGRPVDFGAVPASRIGGNGGAPARTAGADRGAATALVSANRSAGARDARAGPRLAVLPFDSLGQDSGSALFADGLHAEILAALAQRAPWIELVSRTTMMTYRTHPQPVGNLARVLGVTHVIEGSVRREATHTRLTLQLIDARTDNLIWAQSYDLTFADALDLEPAVAAEVISQLSARLGRHLARGGGMRSSRRPQAGEQSGHIGPSRTLR